jgi:hypothetical protein
MVCPVHGTICLRLSDRAWVSPQLQRTDTARPISFPYHTGPHLRRHSPTELRSGPAGHVGQRSAHHHLGVHDCTRPIELALERSTSQGDSGQAKQAGPEVSFLARRNVTHARLVCSEISRPGGAEAYRMFEY